MSELVNWKFPYGFKFIYGYIHPFFHVFKSRIHSYCKDKTLGLIMKSRGHLTHTRASK